MDKAYNVYNIILALVLQFKGYQASCIPVDEPATFTWPLGEGIQQYEISTTSWTGNSNNISYTSGPPSLDYNALELKGTDGSFIEVPVPYRNDTIKNYAIYFYVFFVEDGVFLHYRSDDYADNATSGSFLKSVKMEVVKGNIKTSIGNGHSETEGTTYTSMTYNKWYIVIFQRDYYQSKVKYEIGSPELTLNTGASYAQWVQELPTSFPGTLRFGGSLDGDNYFTGRVTCAHIIPCENPNADAAYETNCLVANWPDSTTSTPITTITTTTTNTATSTMTTTTLPATINTTTPTTTPTITNITIPTTTPFSTTSTTDTSTTTTTTTSTITPPTSTTTRSSSTKTATTTLPTTTSTFLTPYNPPLPISLYCIRYRVAHQNSTFSSAILGTFAVDEPLACSSKCSAHGACRSFAFKSGNCRLGPSSPGTLYDAGSIVYELV